MELLAPEFSLVGLSIVALALLGFWLVALIDILRNDFKGTNEKLIWILVVFFMPFLGTLLYFLIGRKNRINDNK
jgi:hypothetical protein